MITSTSSVIDFEKAERDTTFLLECFREVLRDLGEHELADHLPFENAGIPLERYPNTERALQAFSIFFQLLNMAEENSGAQNRRALDRTMGKNSRAAQGYRHRRNGNPDTPAGDRRQCSPDGASY